MKKYIIAFGLFFLSLFLIDNVYATNVPFYGEDIEVPTNLWFFDGTTQLPTSLIYAKEGNQISTNSDSYKDYAFLSTANTFTVGPNKPLGILYQLPIGLAQDYLYSFTTYMCSTNSSSKSLSFADDTIRATNGFSLAQNNESIEFNYLNEVSSGSSSLPPRDLNYSSGILAFGRCYWNTYLLSPKNNVMYIRYNFRLNADVNGYVSVYGYKLQNLGLYNSTTVSEVKDEVLYLQEQQQQQHNEMKDTITNSDSSDATGDAGSFFEGFNTDTFGLTSIITAPLNLIQNITSKTCTPLNLQVPFVDKTMQLPCMSTIYQRHFGSFLTVYQTITFGIISYWVCIRVFALVKDFKNPDHDEIEVMDL